MISIYPKPGINTTNFPFKPVPVTTFSSISEYVSKYTWSPSNFTNETRREVNFKYSYLVGLDFDNKDEITMTLAEARDNVFCDMRHIIGTTKSHQKKKGSSPPVDRFRVILQLETPVFDLRTYKWTVSSYIERWGADKNASDGARLFYPCNDIVSVSDGYLADVLTPPARYMNFDAKNAELAAFSKLGAVPLWLQRNLLQPVTEGHRNSSVFGLACDLFKIKFDQDFVKAKIFESRVYQDNLNDEEFKKGVLLTITGIFRRGVSG